MGEGARHSGRAGTRLRRRLARRLGAHHHRSRPDALRPPVRTFPQPRARVDAGLRHRLLPGPARRGDRLCARALRRRPGGADHHLRLVPRPRRHAQRRPGARDAARPGRQARQAGADEPRPSRYAEAGGGGRSKTAGGGQGRRAGGEHARHRRAAGRALFQRLDPCGGRRHRRPAADRARAALPRSEGGDAGDPVQHEMGGTGGAGQVRLPRPQDADHASARHSPHRPARDRDRSRQDPARRRENLRDARARRDGRGVPAGKRRHAQGAGRNARRPVRGHHRPCRPLPARPDGQHPDLLRPQARPGEAGLSSIR